MIREICFEEKGREKLEKGIKKLCELCICDGNILVDGHYSIAAGELAPKIEGEDKWENQGIRLLGDAISEINAKVGCGTKEAAQFTLALLTSCKKRIAALDNPILFARQLKKSAEKITERIRQNTQLQQRKETEDVWEEEMVTLLKKGMEYGDVVIKASLSTQTKLELVEGMRIPNSMLTGKGGTYSAVYVLVIDKKMDSFEEILPILEKLGEGKLFLFAKEITGEALQLLKINVKKGILNVWAENVPGIGQRQRDWMEDVAMYTGTTVYHEYSMEQIKTMDISSLGYLEQMDINSDSITIKAKQRNGADRETYLAKIKERIEKPDTNYIDQQMLRDRLAAFQNITPILYIGGDSNLEIQEKIKRAECTYAQMKSIARMGVVARHIFFYETEDSAEQMLLDEILNCYGEDEWIGVELLVLSLKKITSLLYLWMTAGAVLVSTDYDREDIELMKSGVDVDRIRGY